jgi:Uma2 family endonuclease
MDMATQPRVWTREEVLALIDERERRGEPWRKFELIDGELLVDGQPAPDGVPPESLVTPAPSRVHQRLGAGLYDVLRPYVGARGLGELLWSPADLPVDAPGFLQPDLFVVPADVPGTTWEDVTALILAVEIISPSSARADRGRKRRRYQAARVAEYWVVDPDSRLVERWRPDDERPEVTHETLLWRPDPAHPPLTIDLPRLFAAAWGDVTT